MKVSLTVILMMLISCSTQVTANNEQGLLWKVSAGGLNKSSYLFGTHHLVAPEFAHQVKGLMTVLSEVEQVYGEIKTDEIDQESRLLVIREMLMPKEITYEELLSEQEYNFLDQVLISALGEGLESYGTLKPPMINSMLTTAMYVKMVPEFKPSKHEAIDIYLQRLAAEMGKECYGLESAEYQIGIIVNSESLEKQVEALMCAARNMNSGVEMLKGLNELYSKGDLTAMYNLAFDDDDNNPCPYSDEVRFAMNGNRNRKWLEKLPAIFAEKSTLVAVGALHLPGKEGLIAGLRERGYTVEAVSYAEVEED